MISRRSCILVFLFLELVIKSFYTWSKLCSSRQLGDDQAQISWSVRQTTSRSESWRADLSFKADSLSSVITLWPVGELPFSLSLVRLLARLCSIGVRVSVFPSVLWCLCERVRRMPRTASETGGEHVHQHRYEHTNTSRTLSHTRQPSCTIWMFSLQKPNELRGFRGFRLRWPPRGPFTLAHFILGSAREINPFFSFSPFSIRFIFHY